MAGAVMASPVPPHQRRGRAVSAIAPEVPGGVDRPGHHARTAHLWGAGLQQRLVPEGGDPQNATSSSVSRRPRSKKGSDAVAMYHLASACAARFHHALASGIGSLRHPVQGSCAGGLYEGPPKGTSCTSLVFTHPDGSPIHPSGSPIRATRHHDGRPQPRQVRRSAEADGNRTRLSRVAAHTGFGD
jgi:hypothetical protein